MTQKADVLEILKAYALTGISAEGIRSIRWTPQYNRVISDLRDDGHLIISSLLTGPQGEKGIGGFFYCGRFETTGFVWFLDRERYPARVVTEAEINIADFEMGRGRYARNRGIPRETPRAGAGCGL